MECKNASKESLSESWEVNRVLEEERETLLERLAVCVVSVSSSYIMESVGVKRKDGAANRHPPTAFLVLESLREGDVFVFPGGRQLLAIVHD